MIPKLLFHLYHIKKIRLRKFIISLLWRFEGGPVYSKTLRKIFLTYHQVDIGMYTFGGCFNPGQFDRYTTVGRYCSIAMTTYVLNRNHPLDYKSMHAFFFNPALKYCKEDKIEYTPLVIGNDVWLGHNSVILPHVRYIGDGAVIAAGAIVNKDVPPYAVVVGNPGRIVRYRFSKETIEKLLQEKWWEKSIEELKDNKEFFGVYERFSEQADI